MEEIHLTKADFKIEWYSGTGPGGQHRNKRQNCCRITHIESGITVNGTESRSRVDNQDAAFKKLAKLIINYYNSKDSHDKEISNEVIRNYHAVRNEVLDKKSRLKQSYKYVVIEGNLGDMIEARRKEFGSEEKKEED